MAVVSRHASPLFGEDDQSDACHKPLPLEGWTHPDGCADRPSLIPHRLQVKTQLAQDECGDARLLPPRLVAPGRPHVPGAHLGLEKDRAAAAVERTQLRD